MSVRVNRSDVAKLAGVSNTTVSYVLNGKMDVAIPEATRMRVVAAARELGYTPNRAAQALKTGRTNQVALWLSYLNSLYYAQIVEHFCALADRDNYGLIVVHVKPSIESNSYEQLDSLSHSAVDGIIEVYCADVVRDYLKDKMTPRIPAVSLGAYHTEGIDFVGVDFYQGAVDAVEHILASGRRRIAFVADESAGFFTPREKRYLGYVDTMVRAGLKPELIASRGSTNASGYEAMIEYSRIHGVPEGICCLNDDIAVGVHRALTELQLRTPQDVALVGNGGQDYAAYMSPSLSTVSHPLDEMCDLAWQFLMKRMEEPLLEQQTAVLGTNLVIRESSRL